jgi:hypothetical protein
MGKLSKRPARRTKVSASALEVGGKIELSEEERSTLKNMQGALVRLKVSLADLQLQAAQVDEAMQAAVATVRKQEQALREQARSAVRAHGLDPEAKDRAFTVNIDEGAIVRIA